jgi:hypothetical protein
MGHRGTYWRKIRLGDLRYYILTGFIFGAFNGVCAFGPGFLRSLGSDGLVALTSTGPVVPYWIQDLSLLALGIPIFGLLGALSAIPVGYYQLQKFYESSGEGRADPDRTPGPSPRARFPRY